MANLSIAQKQIAPTTTIILRAVPKLASYSWKSVSCIYMGRRLPLGSAGHFQTIKGYVFTPGGFANSSARVSPYMHRQPWSVMRQPTSGEYFLEGPVSASPRSTREASVGRPMPTSSPQIRNSAGSSPSFFSALHSYALSLSSMWLTQVEIAWRCSYFRDSPLNELARSKTFRRDVAVLDVGDEGWLNPCGLRLLDRLGELGLRADHRIELLPDLAGDRAGPSGADLAHVDQVLAFLLAEVERGDAAWDL